MKQAYTNTIRGGGRAPLTIPGGGSKKGRSGKQQQLPKCAYGAACTRKGCAYSHPPASAVPYDNYHQDPRSKICKPFLARLCTYGHKCLNRHPAQEEADAVRATYKEKACSFGNDCQTEGCLYWHPWEAVEADNYAVGEISDAVGGLHLDDASGAVAAVPAYEEWLAMNCPSPPTMDENYVYNMWHYPGSGMQRSPWEVYCLMCPQQHYNGMTTNGTNGLNATAQTWGHATTSQLSAAPQSWEPASAIHQQQQQEDPKTFQEWKKKGQPYPSWFCSDLDPWYDDEGVRRSLEEVYEVLYGENAKEIFEEKQQAQHAQQISNDPTPAELAAMISANDPHVLGTLPVAQQTPSKGGWASIAAKRPLLMQTPTLPSADNDGGNYETAGADGPAYHVERKHRTVVIPREVWLPSTANSDCFHLFPNPIERFNAVNNHHKKYLASVTIPKCFESANSNHGEKSDRGGKVTVLDVHFQSAKTVAPVLNRFLAPALKKNAEVWVVTGSGQHVAAGHQRREGGGVLFNAVKRYLEEREEEMGWEFCIGKDTSGGRNKSSGGAFVVRRLPS